MPLKLFVVILGFQNVYFKSKQPNIWPINVVQLI